MNNYNLIKQRYLEAFKNKGYDTEKAEKLFNIIDNWSDNDFLSYARSQTFSETIKGKQNYGCKNHRHVTDIHGDLNALLFALIGDSDNANNVARFKDFGAPIAFVNPNDFPLKKIDNIIDLTDDEIVNLIPIPNLEINPDFKGIFTNGGDLIDRGEQSESCFYTFVDLINQNENLIENNIGGVDIKYIAGNHEFDILFFENCFDICLLNGSNILELKKFKSSEEDAFLFKKHLENIKKHILFMLISGDMEFIKYINNKTLVSHTSFNLEQIENLKETLAKYGIDRINFLDDDSEEVYCPDKIETKEDIKQLNYFISCIIYNCFFNKEIQMEIKQELIFELKKILNNRDLNKNMGEMTQIIGHTSVCFFLEELGKLDIPFEELKDCYEDEERWKQLNIYPYDLTKRIIICDTNQSSGFYKRGEEFIFPTVLQSNDSGRYFSKYCKLEIEKCITGKEEENEKEKDERYVSPLSYQKPTSSICKIKEKTLDGKSDKKICDNTTSVQKDKKILNKKLETKDSHSLSI